MEYLKSFIVGGIICGIAQILIDKTKMTPARIMVSFVVTGVVLSFSGLYDELLQIGSAGATVPIIGFGNLLAKGVIKGIGQNGFIGIFTGGVTAAAGGIAASVFFGLLMAIIFKPKQK